MRPPFSTAISAVCCFAGITRGYMIHEDCGADTALVREMVEGAFVLAEKAVAGVMTTPNNPNADWLGQQLFQKQGPQLKALIDATFDSQPVVNDRGFKPGILSFRQEQHGPMSSLPKHEVVIYCTVDRLEPDEEADPDDPHMIDTETLLAIPGDDDGCKGFNFMWTVPLQISFDIVQICPWFLAYARLHKEITLKDLFADRRATLAWAGLDELITMWSLTEIDLLSLFDKVMLHEFTHTKAGGEKVDARTPGVSLWKTAYGWKNAKQLAATGRGDNNADNFALYASAYYQFSEGNSIDEKGKFTQKRIGTSSKRWLGSGAGMAWDVTKLDAAKRFI